MQEFLNAFKKNYIILAVFYILFGLVLLIWPAATGRVICYSLGGIAMIYGAINVITYFVKNEEDRFYRFDLVIGLISLLVGLVIIVMADAVISILPILLGIVILVDSFLRIQNAIDLMRVGYSSWWGVLILALVSVVLGVILIFNPFEAASVFIMFVGMCLIYDGIANLCTVGMVSRRLKKMKDLLDSGDES